ncbi:MAG: QueT transporter family protein [Erysipelotrichaceae bacterium]|nr:QueT transporter family protein [Erysipelotrichaceae bacterium]
MKINVKTMAYSAIIAALYTAVSLAIAPLTFGNIQIRFAEALTLLPILAPSTIVGITLGCGLTNLFGAMLGINPLGHADVFIGTAATFVACLLSIYYRNHKVKGVPVISVMMPVVINALIIGAELAYVIMPQSLFVGFITFGSAVFVGQFIACVIIGVPLLNYIDKSKILHKIM